MFFFFFTSPVVSVSVSRRFFFTLIEVGNQDTVVGVNRMAQVLPVLLLF